MKISMKTKRITAAMLAASMILAATACAKEERQTFTGDKTEEPAYQANLDVISPIAYSETDGLNLEPGTYISIIGKDEASAFWKNVKKGVHQAEEDLNKTLGYTGNDKVKVTYNAPAKKENIDEQVNILDEELARYPDVVGVASIDVDACSVQFDLATENGIPVIALDSGNNYQGIQCTVKTDNAEAAKTGAYKLADAMGRTGDILLLVHDSKSETAKERTEAFCAEIEEKYPDVNVAEILYVDQFEELKKQIVEEQYAASNTSETENTANAVAGSAGIEAAASTVADAQNTPAEETDAASGTVESDTAETQISAEELAAKSAELTDEDVILYYLEKYPNVKGMFGTNDMATQLGVSALAEKKADHSGNTEKTENAEKAEDTDKADKAENEQEDEILLMGFDAGKAQLDALKNGEISGLVVQNPFGIGYASVIAAARTVLQAGNEAEVNTGYVWVTKENMESESIRKMLYE